MLYKKIMNILINFKYIKNSKNFVNIYLKMIKLENSINNILNFIQKRFAPFD